MKFLLWSAQSKQSLFFGDDSEDAIQSHFFAEKCSKSFYAISTNSIFKSVDNFLCIQLLPLLTRVDFSVASNNIKDLRI